MKLKDLKFIKNIVIITVSDKPSAESTKISLSVKKLFIILSVYSIILCVTGFLVINFTPLSKLFYSEDYYYQKEEKEKFLELNKKILFLSKEIESLKTTNEKLRYAIILGDSSVFIKKNDSLKNGNLKKRIEGNLSYIIKVLWKLFFSDNQKQQIFTRPMSGFISREFNPDEGHYGIDIAAKTGTPIYAAASGYVLFADYTTEDGYMIIIIHPNDYISIYKHCSSLLKQKKETILQNELIALCGNTGKKSYGPHLHLEIWKNGQPLNPKTLFIN
ncbi:MAG: M23 family metallopeptidase [Ignavibacteriaceae bacterium]|nr:M23 family metallopeptidase [Ignavibacteriaceae bacterium]